ncbi:uncharacterized protein LOC108033210 [Drosophila biarmipes]|uniref:uncharacterized protein LOC108033210 n=1 Tax=Drosophila biarmipes TaxID=125945 RepID=UPI0007E7A4F2|nr:uncharacterized protein LOC108033210 [Drosophila biarmipes]XP_050745779.1 uncharacterized protein LOC108033210 [Drosophila biarmipes]
MATDKTPSQGVQALHKTRTRSGRRRDSNHESPKTWRAGNSLLQKRLRRLIVADRGGRKRSRRDQEPDMSGTRKKLPLWTWGSIVLLVCVGLGLCLQFNENSPTVGGFLESYANQYHSIVHNRDNYCDRSQRLGNIVSHARPHILHQEQALDQLELALDSPNRQIIALVGSSGVGKSFTAHKLRDHFPWPENVKTLSWAGGRSVLRVQSMLSHLVYCGRNLILIDNMLPKDAEYVPVISKLIKGHEEIANRTEQPHLKQLTVVLIFSVNRLQADEYYEEEMETLKQLPGTHVITYAALEPDHLVDCIHREAKIAKVQLDDDHIEEIIRGSDARSSGCKSIPAKVLLFGKPIPEAPSAAINHPTD